MDFFGRAHAARGRSRFYTLMFFLATAGTVVTVGLVTWGVWELYRRYWPGAAAVAPAPAREALELQVLLIGTTALTALIIIAAVIQKTIALSRGGPAIAELLGGLPVPPGERAPALRQLLNVVEEMSIAAGLPVPTVYVLGREQAINAFAAGLSRDDAVVVVTQGALDLLSRDELQGVVAHELSHILNGDMALNMQLTVQLHGLTVLARLGQRLATAPFRDDPDTRRADPNERQVVLELAGMVIGVLVMIVGSIGAAFGGAFLSAVSRQRELLADASAVQFTRNPLGVAGALKKIAATPLGSSLDSPARAIVGHFLFAADGAGFTTHPPLYDRIVAIEPDFDGTLPQVDVRPPPPDPPRAEPARVQPPRAPVTFTAPVAAPRAAWPAVERPVVARLAHVEVVLAGLPPEVVAAVREPSEARAVVTALLLDDDPERQARQLDVLAEAGDPALVALVRKLGPAVRSCPVEAWLPLAQLAAPALRHLSEPQYRGWRRVVFRLVDSAPRLTLFQFALQRSVLRRLESSFTRPVTVTRPPARPLASLGDACAVLLSALARSNLAPEATARAAFGAGIAALGAAGAGLSLRAEADCVLPFVDGALGELAAAAPNGRQLLVTACRAVILNDRTVSMDELELVRAVADALDCPLPPLTSVWAG